jgi:signal transduction histidine kinase/BarA-like signal transduction histidine kinase
MRRSLALRTQLLFTIVGSIAATAVALTMLAYRVQVSNLEREAHRAVRMAADSRAETIARIVYGQQQRAERFLITASSLCGENRLSGGIAWELDCARRALREMRESERAVGAALTSRRRRIALSGVAPSFDLPVPAPLARLDETTGLRFYVIHADHRDASVRLVFRVADFEPLFGQPLGLGAHGDIFLRASDGTLLTPSRSEAPAAATMLVETGHSCTTEEDEWVDVDHRGIPTIHGTRAVSAFVQPLCVEAHIARAESLAPAADLLNDLLRQGAIFALAGALLMLIPSHWMAASLQRLAASARALTDGDFTQPIPASGPSEVRSLARTFATMKRALAEQMRRAQHARQEAETANHAKDEFLAVLSHELRTPLTSTLGWIRLLREKNLKGPQVDRAIAAIERSAQTQERLIEDLLDVSQIIAGRLQLERTAVCLNDPVRTALDELRPSAAEKGVALRVTLEESPIVDADPLRIQQIVANLLTNAIKFTPAGGTVTLSVQERADYAEVIVTDTGIGISPDFLPHVFDPFKQADAGPRRVHGGLGLGLSIVKHLVTLHGGSVDAASRGPGTGSTFAVRLPLAATAIVTNARSSAARSGEATGVEYARTLDALRLLIVDDDNETRQLVSVLLEEAGAEVDVAATAAEGRQRLEEAHYSAIIADLMMPQEDGYAFMRALRARRATMPALALTALARQQDAEAAYDAGFQAFLSKPVDREALIATVAALTR